MIYYDISVIYDSDSECASRGFSYQFPAWTFEHCAGDMPGLGSFTFLDAAFAGSTVFCVDDLVGAYLCHE
jgi:hypothetical protein